MRLLPSQFVIITIKITFIPMMMMNTILIIIIIIHQTASSSVWSNTGQSSTTSSGIQASSSSGSHSKHHQLSSGIQASSGSHSKHHQLSSGIQNTINYHLKHHQLSSGSQLSGWTLSSEHLQGWEGAEGARKGRQRWKTSTWSSKVDANLIIWRPCNASGEKGGERRASSHELRAAKEGGGRSEPKEKELVGL